MSENTQEFKISCPYPYVCMRLTEMVGLMNEWVRREMPGIWESVVDLFDSNYRHQNYLCCAKATVDFLHILMAVLPDSYHKTLLMRYLMHFDGEE